MTAWTVGGGPPFLYGEDCARPIPRYDDGRVAPRVGRGGENMIKEFKQLIALACWQAGTQAASGSFLSLGRRASSACW